MIRITFTIITTVLLVNSGTSQYLPPASLVPNNCTCNYVEPNCFYQKPCAPPCVGIPNPASCTQSIGLACSALANTTTNGISSYIEFNTAGSTELGLASDNITSECTALIRVSGIQTPTSYDDCLQSFQSIQGCGNSANADFNPLCSSGTINYAFCDKNLYSIIDLTKPAYALGSPDQLMIEPGEELALKTGP